MKKLCFGALGIGFGALVSLGGCSISPPADIDTSAVDSFIQAVGQAACDWDYRCCSDPEIKTLEGTKFTTKEQCLPYKQLAAENTLYLDRLAVREGRLRVDDDKAAACLQTQQTKACNPKPGLPAPTPTPRWTTAPRSSWATRPSAPSASMQKSASKAPTA
jgi:hypothetical protein